MPLIVLPKSCSCRWRPCPPAPSHPFLVWVLASAGVAFYVFFVLLQTLSRHNTDSAQWHSPFTYDVQNDQIAPSGSVLRGRRTTRTSTPLAPLSSPTDPTCWRQADYQNERTPLAPLSSPIRPAGGRRTTRTSTPLAPLSSLRYVEATIAPPSGYKPPTARPRAPHGFLPLRAAATAITARVATPLRPSE